MLDCKYLKTTLKMEMQNIKDFLAIGTADNILLSTDAVENCIKSFLNVINGSPDRFLFEIISPFVFSEIVAAKYRGVILLGGCCVAGFR